MTVDPRTGMSVLDEQECWRRLGSTELARIALVVGFDLEIFPVNIAVDGRSVVFRTAEGTKLAAATIAPSVALEADGFDERAGTFWSVVAKGRAERLELLSDVYAAESLPVPDWSGHHKGWYVRVHCVEITGREFARSTAGA